MTTITVPATTLPVGASTFSGSVDDVANQIAITTDRTPAGGMNDLTSDTALSIQVTCSYDAGATYEVVGGGGPWPGGTVLDRHGVPDTFDQMATSLNPGTGRLVRLTVTIAGPVSVVVAGSIVTS